MKNKVHKELKSVTKKKKKEPSKIGIYAQLILTVAIVILLISYLVNKKFLIYLQLAVGLEMFAMAYNNYTIYKRRGFTICYTAVGIVLLGIILFNLFW